MRIVLINALCGTGSTGKIVQNLLESVIREGGDGRIAYGVGTSNGVPPELTVKIGSKADYYFHNALSKLTDHTGLYSVRATEGLIRFLREYDPDIIHLHNIHGYYINFEILFAYLKACGKPVVWTLHDCWAFTGHCAHFSLAGCEGWRGDCSHCPLLRRYPKCYLWGDSRNNLRRKKESFSGLPRMQLITPSEWLAETARQSFLSQYPIRAIPNGIDLSVFRPTESSFREDYGLRGKKIVLAVSSVWNRAKGFEDVLSLAGQLRPEYRVVIVGVNEKQRRFLPDNVIGIARTQNQKELAALYTAADVFINPSYEETMGMTTVEAMACGTPVVVYDQTAVPETVSPQSGLVVRAGDLSALKTAVEGCAFSSGQVRRRAEDFSLDRQMNAQLQLYRRMLEA